MKSLATIAIFGGLLGAIYYALLEYREVSALRKIVDRITADVRFTRRDQLAQLQRYLFENISYEGLDVRGRPLLRDPASKTLKSGLGYCGENARVAILLLLIGGCRANRVYLKGKRWGHVLVEHLWEGHWVFFDGHRDPKTVLAANALGALSSDDLSLLPNEYVENPWQSASRLKQLVLIEALAQVRLPRALIFLFESPYAIKALGAAGIAATGLGYLTLAHG